MPLTPEQEAYERAYLAERSRRTREEWMRGYRCVLEARDPTTSPERLREMSHDPIRPVRFHVAAHPRCPPDVLVALVRDPASIVRGYALRNPAMPEEGLRLFADAEARLAPPGSFDVREVVIVHPNCGPQLRRELRAIGVQESQLLKFLAGFR